MTRTPPTIRADASIRAASKLLKEVGMSTWASHLVAEIELCLSWEQVLWPISRSLGKPTDIVRQVLMRLNSENGGANLSREQSGVWRTRHH